MTILTEKERRLLFGTLFGTPSAKQSSPPLWRKALAILVIGLPIIGIVLWGETLQHHQYPSLSPLSPFEIGGAIGGFAGVIALFVAIVALFFAPTIVAIRREHRNQLAITILNIFLGWTLIGWVAALVWACTAETHQDKSLAQ